MEEEKKKEHSVIPTNYVTLVELQQRWKKQQDDRNHKQQQKEKEEEEKRYPPNYVSLTQLQQRWRHKNQDDQNPQDHKRNPHHQNDRPIQDRHNRLNSHPRNFKPDGNDAVQVEVVHECLVVQVEVPDKVAEKNDAVHAGMVERNDAVQVMDAAAVVAVSVEGNESENDGVKEVKSSEGKKKWWGNKKKRKVNKQNLNRKRSEEKQGEEAAASAQGEEEQVTARVEHAPPLVDEKSRKKENVPVMMRCEYRPKITNAKAVEIETKMEDLSIQGGGGEENEILKAQNKNLNGRNRMYRNGYNRNVNGDNTRFKGSYSNHRNFEYRHGYHGAGNGRYSNRSFNGSIKPNTKKDGEMVWVKKGEVVETAETATTITAGIPSSTT